MNYLNYFEKLDNHYEKKDNKRKDLDNKQQCKNCKKENSIIYDYINYNEICSECGIIYNEILDQSAEWRNYGYSDNKKVDSTRCGNPINYLLPKSSMSTTISSYGSNSKVKMIQKWNQISNDERSRYEVFKKIDDFLRNQKFNKKIIDDAKLYYKILCEKDKNENKILTRGKIRTSLIVACIYISSKNNNKPINEKKLLKIFKIKKTDLTKGLKKFSNIEKEKNLNINNNNNTIHDLINLYGKQFNIRDDIIDIIHLIYIRSLMINIKIDKNKNKGKEKERIYLKNSGEKYICSGLFFFISIIFKLNLSKQNIIDKINVSEVTLNKIYKLFDKHIDILILGFDKIKSIN